MKIPLILLSCVFLTACATWPPVTWYHTLRAGHLQEDLNECVALGNTTTFAKIDCLKQKGWNPVRGNNQQRCETLSIDFDKQVNAVWAVYKQKKERLLKASASDNPLLTSDWFQALIQLNKELTELQSRHIKEADFCYSPKAIADAKESVKKRENLIFQLEANQQKLIFSKITLDDLNQAVSKDGTISSLLMKK